MPANGCLEDTAASETNLLINYTKGVRSINQPYLTDILSAWSERNRKKYFQQDSSCRLLDSKWSVRICLFLKLSLFYSTSWLGIKLQQIHTLHKPLLLHPWCPQPQLHQHNVPTPANRIPVVSSKVLRGMISPHSLPTWFQT